MIPNAPDIPKSPPRIKHDGKFYSMLLSKESSLANNSFRVAPGSVPFEWESVPGTPKVTIAATAIPPITPPPSYRYHADKTNLKSKTSVDEKKKKKKKKKKNPLITAIFRKLTLIIRRKQARPSSSRIRISSSSSQSTSSSSSSFSQSANSSSRFSSSRTLFSSVRDESGDLPRCFLCFRVRLIPRVFFFKHGHKGKIGADHWGEI